MKCYEVTNCSEQERATCYVWNSLNGNPQEMENIKCWVLKGAYNEGSGQQLVKCQQCKYYLMMNKDTGIVSEFDAQVAIVTCQGTINNDRSKALEKVWVNLKQSKKSKILLDLTDCNNIYSCGLGMVVKMHKEADAAGGILVVVGVRGYVQSIFTSTKLSKILHLVADRNQAGTVFEEHRKKQEAAQEVQKIKVVVPVKKRIPCWDYFKNQNPRNATLCDECFKKISLSQDPCWIVEGIIEGVSFQYVNESCEDCSYYKEYGASQQCGACGCDDITELTSGT